MVRETFGPHPRPSSAPDIVTYLARTLLFQIFCHYLVMCWSSSSQTNTFWHKWIPHFTITLMIIHFFTWALWLGYRRMNVILERKQSPEAHQKYIGARRFINPEKLWQIKRKHTLTLLWPQLPFFVYQLSQHIPPGNISFKGNAAELVDNWICTWTVASPSGSTG